MTTKKKRLIILHDSFRSGSIGGAERVVARLCDEYKETDVYTVVSDRLAMEQLGIKNKVINSPLQYLYDLGIGFAWLLPLLPLLNFTWKLPESSVILSSSSLFLKGIKKPKNSFHIAYCHTPVRFLWSDKDYVYNRLGIFAFFVLPFFVLLRKLDVYFSCIPDIILANSFEVKRRIATFYKREATVIYPFVDMDFWKKDAEKDDYFLVGGRLTYQKGFEEVVDIFNNNGKRLVVFGEGVLFDVLKEKAGSNITFVGRVDDLALRKLYSSALCLIYPQVEDFGLPPLEASLCGTSVLAIGKGGSLETVKEGVNGRLFNSREELVSCIDNFDDTFFDYEKAREYVSKFDVKNFVSSIDKIINENSY